MMSSAAPKVLVIPMLGDRGFESTFLQLRVTCELVLLARAQDPDQTLFASAGLFRRTVGQVEPAFGMSMILYGSFITCS
jgi:hypothetical protein